MHIQIVNFHLKGLSHNDYAKACEEVFGPAFTQVDGLLSKIWLANAETNTYGGIYTWKDRPDVAPVREPVEEGQSEGRQSRPDAVNLTGGMASMPSRRAAPDA